MPEGNKGVDFHAWVGPPSTLLKAEIFVGNNFLLKKWAPLTCPKTVVENKRKLLGS